MINSVNKETKMPAQILITQPVDKTTGQVTDLLQWGLDNLSPEDYSRLVAAAARQDALMQNAGATIQNITEVLYSPTLQANIEVAIGCSISFPNGPPQNDPEYEAFDQMFSQDPNVTYYQPIHK